MQTRELWICALKKLRETNEVVLLNAVSNVHTTFTHDTIIITAPNQTAFEIIKKHLNILKQYTNNTAIEIKVKPEQKFSLTLEQKLEKIFGDKYNKE